MTTQALQKRYGVLTESCPRIEEDQAAEMLTAQYGLDHIALQRISTEKDDTFMVSAGSSPQRFIFKIEHPSEGYDRVLLRVDALRRLETHDGTMPVTRVRQRVDGGFITRCGGEAGTRWATLTTVVPGRILASVQPPYAKPLLIDIGACLAQVERTLAPLNDHPSDTPWLWDPRSAPAVARDLAVELQDVTARHLVEQAAAGCEKTLQHVAQLPLTLCHADFHPGNLSVTDHDPQHVGGIFDFGDMHMMPAVCDVGTSLLYFLNMRRPDDPFASCRSVLEGYRRINPAFNGTMTALLPAVMKARCILTILLPLLAVTSDRSRAGHYQATAQIRLDELRLLCDWDERAIVRALSPI